MAQNSVKPLVLTNISSTTVGGTYAAINASGFEHAPFFIRIINHSDKDITVSYNGVDDHEFVITGSVFELSSQTNSQPNAQVALLPKKTVVYVKGTAGTGTIYLSGYYV